MDSIIAEGNPIEAVKLYTEIGVESDLIEHLQAYLQKRTDLDTEVIEVVQGLAFLQLMIFIGNYERISAYREALYN